MILLDYRDKRPIYEQIVDKLERLIVGGGLEANYKMPSVRSMAMELSVNPNTIQRAYAMLEQEGYIYTVSGRGSFVAHECEGRSGKVAEVTKELEEVLGKAKEVGMTLEATLQVVNKTFKEAGDD